MHKIKTEVTKLIANRFLVLCLLAVSLSFTALSGMTFASERDSIQGYIADSQLQPGTVVELVSVEKGEPEKVAPISKDHSKKMFGVVVDRSKLSMIISNEPEGEVFVATSGTQQALVSTENGEIKSGDYLTPSSVNGVLMRADTRQETIFGRAASSYTNSSVAVGTMSLKDSDGKTHAVKLGLVAATIDIKKNPNIESTKANLPEFLEDIGQQIAKKDVNPIRIYLSMAITAVSLITAIVVLYSGVRNGVVAIGRNPMSKKSIFRALLEIILTSIAVLMVGLFAVYLLLRL